LKTANNVAENKERNKKGNDEHVCRNARNLQQQLFSRGTVMKKY
jgi:hypothetical protein